jgi:hypothetical protein
MPLLHFHVDSHDVGYMPDPDNVATFVAIDDAIDYVITRAEEWLDNVAVIADEDPHTPTRGQPYATEPHTYGQELLDVNAAVKEIQESLRTNDEFTADVTRQGLLIVMEDGWSVIELTPCSEDTCDEYREEWIE